MNGTQITALDRPPTALEFSQMVALSRPVVFRTGAEVPDASTWTTEYLAQTMGDRPISVSVTPDGYVRLCPNQRLPRPRLADGWAFAPGRNADALRELAAEGGGHGTYFVEPLNESMPLREFLRRLEGPSWLCLVRSATVDVLPPGPLSLRINRTGTRLGSDAGGALPAVAERQHLLAVRARSRVCRAPGRCAFDAAVGDRGSGCVCVPAVCCPALAR
jgi:hypothetical protein